VAWSPAGYFAGGTFSRLTATFTKLLCFHRDRRQHGLSLRLREIFFRGDMTQSTKSPGERPKTDAAESDFPDPSDVCDFGYVLVDKAQSEKSPPKLRSVGR